MNRIVINYGIVPIGLLLIALVMNLLHIPNHAIAIVSGVLIFLLAELPLFLIQQNTNKETGRAFNFITFLFLFILIASLFFALQNIIIPRRISIILAVLSGVAFIYFVFNELKKKRLAFKRLSFIHFYLVFLLFIVINVPFQLQAPDYTFNPKIENPAYEKGNGPIIFIDEGHNNYHTLKDRLIATGQLLENDGYIVLPLNETIRIDKLNECSVLVIINALNEKNENLELPIFSAFSEKEISDITQWVSEGGSLLLIADHMPFPEAINDLANKFGFNFENGHAMDTIGSPDYFIRNQKTLHSNYITNGSYSNESVDSILTFSGSAFTIPDNAVSILEFDSNWVSYNPERAWDFDNVKPISIKGYSQGAFKEFGKGRVAVYGEAMMFTAQLGAGLSWMKIGMNSEMCPQNYQLLLNTIHWLDGITN